MLHQEDRELCQAPFQGERAGCGPMMAITRNSLGRSSAQGGTLPHRDSEITTSRPARWKKGPNPPSLGNDTGLALAATTG